MFRPEVIEALQGPSVMSASSTFNVEHWRITTRSLFSASKSTRWNFL